MRSRKTYLCLVTALLAGCGGGSSDEVIVLNPGDGLPVESFRGMDVADVDGDGFPDIVAMSTWTDGAGFFENRLNVFRQNAANPGTFASPERLVLDEKVSLWNIDAVDLDLNGSVEIIATRSPDPGFVTFEQNPAMPGQFLAPARHGASSPLPGALVGPRTIADLDGDLLPDVVTIAGNGVVFYRQLGTSPATFAAAVLLAEGSDEISVGDMNGDGATDLLTFRRHPVDNDLADNDIEVADTVLVHTQDASLANTFVLARDFEFDFVGNRLASADLDNNGMADLILSGSKSIGNDITHHLAIYRQNFPLQFDPIELLLTGGDILFAKLAIADLDGDGDLEIIAGYDNSFELANEIEIFAQDGVGLYRSLTRFALPDDQSISPQDMYAIAVGDLNADGLLDIAASTRELFVVFQRSGSPGEFEAPRRIAAQR